MGLMGRCVLWFVLLGVVLRSHCLYGQYCSAVCWCGSNLGGSSSKGSGRGGSVTAVGFVWWLDNSGLKPVGLCCFWRHCACHIGSVLTWLDAYYPGSVWIRCCQLFSRWRRATVGLPRLLAALPPSGCGFVGWLSVQIYLSATTLLLNMGLCERGPVACAHQPGGPVRRHNVGAVACACGCLMHSSRHRASQRPWLVIEVHFRLCSRSHCCSHSKQSRRPAKSLVQLSLQQYWDRRRKPGRALIQHDPAPGRAGCLRTHANPILGFAGVLGPLLPEPRLVVGFV
jgi:hypothetical protein